MKAVSRWSENVKLTPDVVVCCLAPQYAKRFVVGCYFHEAGNHKGNLITYERNPDTYAVQRLQTLHTTAVFDLKWHLDDLTLLDVVFTDGVLRTYQMTEEGLKQLTEHSVSSHTLLHLSRLPSTSSVAVTDTSGSAHLLDTSLTDTPIHSFTVAETEPWCCLLEPGTLFTGSDDSSLRQWDTRATGRSVLDLEHGAGVTQVIRKPGSQLLLTGSYDDHLRVWDLRAPAEPLDKVNWRDGVWRLDWRADGLLGAACMRGGVNFASVSDAGEIEVRGHFEGPHDPKKLVYGFSWFLDDGFASVSFYDQVISVASLGNE
eukprot:gnl/Dysnectes_brevis/1539_a1747_1109.p1 GENE.gnl/Dysnectes_brevis/1539_a1747_1109~~gnl/Dysnectes_brevis/1539_a1747_1109.p1  ORF type:complete len:316 (-),score=60.59 gnl/Dysnectes_brevis/1539_a1747_1109:184-1131(-)